MIIHCEQWSSTKALRSKAHKWELCERYFNTLANKEPCAVIYTRNYYYKERLHVIFEAESSSSSTLFILLQEFMMGAFYRLDYLTSYSSDQKNHLHDYWILLTDSQSNSNKYALKPGFLAPKKLNIFLYLIYNRALDNVQQYNSSARV